MCSQIAERAQAISSLAEGIARIDVFSALAQVSSGYGYVRPHLTDGDGIEIKGGRHPVVERVIPPGTFVPNDTYLSTNDAQLVVLTGPNMAGKSTYIRQVALIVLMAQIGSFVPAESATIGLVDRIFTRVGLQDDLATGSVHIYDRDGGDRRHPEPGHLPLPGHSGRDRAGHQHLRRTIHSRGPLWSTYTTTLVWAAKPSSPPTTTSLPS